ncbi:ion channel [Mesorhizobium amorphae]|uniref:ion channel n=1 Tax=Mesorhizobium amorphae TaxID=71433 RepID=UPI00177DC335
MIAVLVLGLLAMSVCLAFQALASVLAARYFARATKQPLGPKPWRSIFLQFSILMIVLMIGNIVQVAFWALLYRSLGAFEDFETAVYFSGVTFTSLGYGDVVLSGRMRLLAPLQAANGLMMFGVTTALFIAAVQHATAKWSAAHPARARDAG